MSGLKLPLTRETRQLLQSREGQLFPGLKELQKETGLDLRVQDPASHVLVRTLPEGRQAISLVIPFDDNDQSEDGRIFLKDTFFFDQTGKKFQLLTREFQLQAPKGNFSEKWKPRLQQLKAMGPPSQESARSFAEQGMLSHVRPFFTNQKFWEIVKQERPVQNFLTRMARDAQSIIPNWRVRGPDADSHYIVLKNKDQWVLLNRWVFDKDAEPRNGRIFIQDRFVMDPTTRELTAYERSFVSKDDPFLRKTSQTLSTKAEALLEELNQIPQPEWEEAESFFNSTRDVFFLPINLKGVGMEESRALWDNKDFFKNLGSVGKRFLVDLVEDARKIHSNLFIRASDSQSRYQFRHLGGRTELLFSYLVTDYDDESKNRIICHDRFVFNGGLTKLFAHSRYYEPVKQSFSDPSLLSRVQEINESWQSDPKSSLAFIRQVTPALRLVSIPLMEEILDDQISTKPLGSLLPAHPLELEGSYPRDLLSQGEKDLLREGAGILLVLVLEKLQQEFDRSKGWAHFGKKSDFEKRQEAAHSLIRKLRLHLENYQPGGLSQALKKLDLDKEETELRNRILSDPLMMKLLDVGSESDPWIRDHELMTFAREDLFKRHHLPETAVTIAGIISKRSPDQKDAKELVNFVEGGGSIGTKIEYMGPQFLDHVLDGKMLLAMMGAGIGGSLFEAGGLLGLGRLGALGRFTASGIGIAGEAATFTTIHKAAHSATMDPKKVWSTWGPETLHAMMLFGFMRVAHGSTALLGQQMAKSSWFAQTDQALVAGVHPTGRLMGTLHSPLNGFAKGVLGTLNFAGGVESMYLANWAGAQLHLIPDLPQSFAHHQFDALTTYLTAMVGFRLANGITGGKLALEVGELKIRSRNYRELLNTGWKPGDPLPSTVGLTESTSTPDLPLEVELPPENVNEKIPEVELETVIIERPRRPKEKSPVDLTPEKDRVETDSPILEVPVISFELPQYLLKKGSIIEGENIEGVPKLLRRIRGYGELAALTEEGPGRAENQDNFGFAITPNGLVMIVADGMGGQKGMDLDGKSFGGKESANLAMNLFIDHLIQGVNFEDAANLTNQAILEKFPNTGVCFAAARVVRSTEPGTPDFLEAFWAGDTKLSLLRRDSEGIWQWIYRTQDNSLSRQWVDLEIEAGVMNPANRTMEIVTHPRNNVVINGLGRSFNLQGTHQGEIPDPGSALGWKLAEGVDRIPIQEGDMLIIRSDSGPDNEIKTQNYLDFLQPVRNAQEAAERSHAETLYRMKVLQTAQGHLLDSPRENRYGFIYDGQDPRLHGEKVYINKMGFVYDAPLKGNLIAKFAMDNITVAAYRHQSGTQIQSKTENKAPSGEFEAEKTDIIPILRERTLNEKDLSKTDIDPAKDLREISGAPLSGPSGLPETVDFSWQQVKGPGGETFKDKPVDSLGGVDLNSLALRVMKEVREEVSQQVSGALPFSEMPKSIPIKLMVNLGAITGEPRFNNKSIRLDVWVYPKKNSIQLDMEWVQMLKERLSKQNNPKLQAILSSFKSVHGMKWFEDPLQLDAFLSQLVKKPLPPAGPDADIADHNRIILQSYNANVTIIKSRWAPDVVLPSRYLAGRIFMDEFGYIVLAQLNRPNLQAPPTMGAVEPGPEGSLGIPVLVAGTTVVWADPPQGINSRQQAALRELTHGTHAIKEKEPYAIPAILRIKEGPLALDLANLLEDFIHQTQGSAQRYRIQIVKAADHYRAYGTTPAGAEAKALHKNFNSLEASGSVLVEITPGEEALGLPKNIRFLPEPNIPGEEVLMPLLKYLRDRFLRIQ